MELRDAYRILEVPEGANESEVRAARKTLAKVWHPDRHAHDPEVEKRAQTKLGDINAAFECISAAGFPSRVDPPAPAPRPAPKPTPAPPRAEAPPSSPPIEFVPRRRVRWSVVLLLAGALAGGSYVAIVKLGARDASGPSDPKQTTPPDPKPTPPDPKPTPPDPKPTPPDPKPTPPDPKPTPPADERTFTLGSTRAEVIAAQGEPNGDSTSQDHRTVTENGRTVTESVDTEQLTFGTFSSVSLDRGRVIGWWERDVKLHVRLEPRDETVATRAKTRGTLARGASRDEVIGVLGTPTQITRAIHDRWYYSFSFVEFDDQGFVIDSYESDRPLRFAR
jgi:hypothetical protein